MAGRKGSDWVEIIVDTPGMGTGCSSLKKDLVSAQRKLAAAQRKFDATASRAVKQLARVEKAASKAAGKKRK